MEFLIVLFPLIGALVALVFGRKLGARFAIIFTTSLVGFSLVLSLYCFGTTVVDQRVVVFPVFTWWSIGLMRLNWGVLIDSLAVLMLLVVLVISFLVHLYSIGYMAEDPHQLRFFGYLSLFTFFMLLLVTAPSFPQLFVGWEGVGVCSYLLISFWFTRKQAVKAALKAMVVNRIGDLGLIAAMAIIYKEVGTLDLVTICALAHTLENASCLCVGQPVWFVPLISFLLLLGAIGKSAQLGLHSWLPDAMEGPTPVSALIHAATMVTAGIFLLVRFSPLLELSPAALNVISLVGALTALFGASVGLYQYDLKRVIAYSTCSQLGYMVFACGFSAYSVALFHLYNHAFFKALLFLGSGAIIHACMDEQDMRRFGGTIRFLPFTYVAMLVGSLSLAGFPFLTGFYSKDLILEVVFASSSPIALFVYGLGCISAFFTAYYSTRLVYLTFLGKPRMSANFSRKIGGHEVVGPMFLVLVLLVFGSLFFGFFFKELFVGLGTPFWGSTVVVAPANLAVVWVEFLPNSVKLIPIIFSIVGILVAFFLHQLFYQALVLFQLGVFGRLLVVLLNGRWLIDAIQNSLFSFPALRFGYNVAFRSLDRGVIELLGPTGLFRVVGYLVQLSKTIQTGFVYHYSFFFLVAVVFLVGLTMLDLSICRWIVVFLCLVPFSHVIHVEKNSIL